MSTLPFAQIDAFASQAFEGNQACVIPLEAFLPDQVMQKIAAENNVAETAFIVPNGDGVWKLRWFTPAVEVPLCGHATLAAGHYLYAIASYSGEQITFQTVQSGDLFVSRLPDGRLEMDFPAQTAEEVAVDAEISAAFGKAPTRAFIGPCYVGLYESAEDIRSLAPDLERLKTLGTSDGKWGLGNFGCLALDGADVDVTSRFFAPGSGIPEDPATGSWHCMVAPLVEMLTGEREAKCFQAYPGRGAYVDVELVGDRVKLRGHSVTVIEGTFTL
ncbi:MAG: PhzF family phenazine biosynthesis protein [Alphaproteobacteria bacterium]|nr:PhzF family phenazine biosynthesis protein [Alphaproteobacteria bacterium]